MKNPLFHLGGLMLLGILLCLGLETARGAAHPAPSAGSGPTWFITTVAAVDAGASIHYSNLSIGVDPNSVAYISYRDPLSQLAYATNPNHCWSHEIVYAPGVPVARENALALDSSNQPHISFSFSDGSNEKLLYARKPVTGPWAVETVDPATSTGLENALKLDHNGTAHISYWRYAGSGLRYATNSSGSWAIDEPTAAGWDRTAIAVDTNNYEHIIYKSGNGLSYATNSSGTWQLSSVTASGSSAALAIGSDNTLYLTYSDANGDLNYATNATGSWVTETIASNVGADRDHAIAVDTSNHAHVSFRDANQSALQYATNLTGAWAIYPVDRVAGHDIGHSNTIALDANNRIYIAYRDDQNAQTATLKYASTVAPQPCVPPTDTPTSTATAPATVPPTNTRPTTPTPTPGGPTMPPGSPTATPTVCAIEFQDVPPGSAFFPHVRCLACRGILGGYPCGGPGEPCPGAYYRPGTSVTRSQVSKIVAEAAGLTDPVPSTQQTFADVPPGSTFYLYIERLASRGVINGYPCGGPFEPCVAPTNRPYFRPGNSVTRGQLAKIVTGAAGWTETPTGQTFADVPPGDTFYLYVERMAGRGVMSGYPCGGPFEPCVPPPNRSYFRPTNPATRGQTAKIVANSVFPNCQAIHRVSGLNFSPYLHGQDPNVPTPISAAQIRARLELVAPYTEWVRTFGVSNGLENSGRIAHDLHLNIAMEAWLSRDLAANDQEISTLIARAQANEADLLIVGSEVLLRGDLTEAQLLGYINRVKQAVPGATVTTAEVYNVLLDHPQVITAVDTVFANIYPFWEGVPMTQALATLEAHYTQLQTAANGKVVWIAETGWPSCGEPVNLAVPSPENAAAYFVDFAAWARAYNRPNLYFAAFDEHWKVQYEGDRGGCWGGWDENGNMKPGRGGVFTH